MPYYEVMCLASGKLGRADLRDLIRKTCRAFMDNGAVVSRVTPLGASGHGPRKLAYKIRRNQVTHKTGFYINVCAFASPDTLAEVKRQLRIDERMLRHMAIRRSAMDVVKKVPDMDEVLVVDKGLDPLDPEHALKKFMMEYEMEFPDGKLRLTEPVEEEGEMDMDGKAVDGVLERLRESSLGRRKKGDGGLAWLSGIKDRDDSPPRKGR